MVWSRLGMVARSQTARACGAVVGILCAQIAGATDGESQLLSPENAISAKIAPGEQHRYTVSLAAGRNHIALLENGIDLSVSVTIDDELHLADSPTSRFALEQLWLELPEDLETTIVVSALQTGDVPTGNYELAIRTNHLTSPEFQTAEKKTEFAMRMFNDSYANDLALKERRRLRKASLDAYIEAANIFTAANEARSAAYCWHAAAYISGRLLKDHNSAKQHLQLAADNYRTANLIDHQYVALKDIGRSLVDEELFGDAATYYSTLQTPPHASDQITYVYGVINNDLCFSHTELGNYGLANSLCQRALDAFSELGDVSEHNNTLLNLASVKWLAGDWNGAIDRLYDLLEEHRSIGNHISYAQTLNLLVDYLYQTGDIDPALNAFDQAIEIFEREGMLIWQASVLTKYSRIEKLLGRREEARRHLERALLLAKAENSTRWEGIISVALAEADLEAGRTEAAIRTLNSAIEIFSRSESVDAMISATLALANAQLQAGSPKQAADTIDRLGDDHVLQANSLAKTHLIRARIHAVEGQQDKSIATARRAAAGFEALGNLAKQLEAAEFEAALLAQQDRWDESLQRLEGLRKLVRRVGHTLIVPELKARYFSQQRHFYEALMKAHRKMASSDDEAILRTLNVVEEARATALRTHLETPSGRWLDGMQPELRNRYKRARDFVTRLVGESIAIEGADRPELIQALHDLERIQSRIWRENTTFAEISNDQPIVAADLDRVLDDRTAILYFYVGATEHFALLLEPGRRTHYAITTERSIATLTAAVLDEYRSPNSQFGIRAASAQDLADALLGPISDRLSDFERLIVVPDAGLHNLPFGALPNPQSGRVLIETLEVSSVPSLRAAINYEAREKSSGLNIRIAAIGDPVTSGNDPRLRVESNYPATDLDRLYGSSEELIRVQAIFESQDVSLHTGFDASKQLFLESDLAGVDILHIAAHGVSSDTLSAKSGLFLSTLTPDGRTIDGHLGQTDLFGLELNIPLVVLSGCETSMGEQLWAEGPIGIARAFQYSGVPNVVSTLWKIDDAASTQLVEAFYRSLATGQSVPAALRLAQLEMMQNAAYRHPYYWAAYQSLGNWSLRWEELSHNITATLDPK